MNTLITWTDRPSPVPSLGRVSHRKNPILSLVRHPSTSFERVFLLYTPSVLAGTKQLAAVLKSENVDVRLVLCSVEDTGAYSPWFQAMSEMMKSVATEKTVGLISAGPPSARAAWLALHAVHEFKGRLVQIRDGRIYPVDLGREAFEGSPVEQTALRDGVRATERRMIVRALQETGHNLLQTSRRLEIDRNTLKRKMQQLGIARTARLS